ncbi:MAG: enoyl-CoA hydratase-related protein [Kiloniellales bacterium]|nr:enoyl-CoA hydratase-related protein [Kiloniellales bacterium]
MNVIQVTLNRPRQANAFNTKMAEELLAFWKGLGKGRQAARAVILTGSGDRAFCAGADLKERDGMSDDDWRKQHKIFEEMSYSIMESPIPVIAAVNGAAFGGGCELVLASDFAYAAQGARFALTEVSLGIMPGIGATQRLPRLVGPARAKEFLMTAKPIGAQDAHRWGLVNQLCSQEELLPAALETAERIASNAPLAVAAVRRAADAAGDLPLKEGLAVELENYYGLVETEDRFEGIRAFNEKRKPLFKGR